MRALRYPCLVLSLMAMMVMGTGSSGGAVPVSASSLPDGATTSVVVHYHRFDGSYTGWNLWLWPAKPTAGNGAEYDFSSSDSFGQVAHAQVPGNNTQVGIIVRLNNWDQKDVSQDRFIDTPNGSAEVWLIQGDPTIYTSESDAAAAVAAQSVPRVVNAYLDSPTDVYAQLSVPGTITGADGGFSVKDTTAGRTMDVASVGRGAPLVAVLAGDLQPQLGAAKTWDPTDDTTQLKQVNNDLYQLSGDLPAGSYQYKIALNHGWVQAYPSDNVNLTVPAGGAHVTFSFVPSSHTVYDSINNPNAQLPGAGAPMVTDLVKITLASPPDITHSIQIAMGNGALVTVTPRLVLNDPQYT